MNDQSLKIFVFIGLLAFMLMIFKLTGKKQGFSVYSVGQFSGVVWVKTRQALEKIKTLFSSLISENFVKTAVILAGVIFLTVVVGLNFWPDHVKMIWWFITKDVWNVLGTIIVFVFLVSYFGRKKDTDKKSLYTVAEKVAWFILAGVLILVLANLAFYGLALVGKNQEANREWLTRSQQPSSRTSENEITGVVLIIPTDWSEPIEVPKGYTLQNPLQESPDISRLFVLVETKQQTGRQIKVILTPNGYETPEGERITVMEIGGDPVVRYHGMTNSPPALLHYRLTKDRR